MNFLKWLKSELLFFVPKRRKPPGASNGYIGVEIEYVECFACGMLVHRWKTTSKKFMHKPRGSRGNPKPGPEHIRIKFWCHHCGQGAASVDCGYAATYKLDDINNNVHFGKI